MIWRQHLGALGLMKDARLYYGLLPVPDGYGLRPLSDDLAELGVKFRPGPLVKTPMVTEAVILQLARQDAIKNIKPLGTAGFTKLISKERGQSQTCSARVVAVYLTYVKSHR